MCAIDERTKLQLYNGVHTLLIYCSSFSQTNFRVWTHLFFSATHFSLTFYSLNVEFREQKKHRLQPYCHLEILLWPKIASQNCCYHVNRQPISHLNLCHYSWEFRNLNSMNLWALFILLTSANILQLLHFSVRYTWPNYIERIISFFVSSIKSVENPFYWQSIRNCVSWLIYYIML